MWVFGAPPPSHPLSVPCSACAEAPPAARPLMPIKMVIFAKKPELLLNWGLGGGGGSLPKPRPQRGRRMP